MEFVKRRTAKNVAPGPDGIKATIWKRVPAFRLMASCMFLCLKKGQFPSNWKDSKLVLIPKGNGTAGGGLSSPPKARPICLLNEISKTFERIIADRLIQFMDDHEQSNLSANQFGFRRHRSTIDALRRVRGITSEAVEAGDVAIAVKIDIRNAFNSISRGGGGVIVNAMVKGFPPYRKMRYQPEIKVGSTFLRTGHSMKYLGVMIDGHWSFRTHLDYVQRKAAKVVRALGKLMPNLRGPSMRRRSLYSHVVTSVVLYAAPLWADVYNAAPYRITRPLRTLQRSVAIRIVFG